MKASLHLNISHQLTLTPELQQAIRLLQLSTLDLQLEIKEQLLKNPMLEEVAEDITEIDALETSNDHDDEFEDFQWDTLYTSKNVTNPFNENDYIFETLHCTSLNLHDHLRWQLDLSPMSDLDRIISETVLDAINDDGLLMVSISDLHESLESSEYPLEINEIEAVLHRIQRLDPIGCGAINLSDALKIQLEHLPADTDHLDITKEIISKNLDLLGQHNYRQLMKIYQIDENTMASILNTIRHLNPKPGRAIAEEKTEYITPDLTVKKINHAWQVQLNQNMLPNLTINSQYASLIKKGNNQSDCSFLKNNLQEARWFLKCLQSRQDTLLKVARYIVDYQQDFFEMGAEAMKPLILNDVAKALDMHESTVSRVTTQKYIHTPRGVLELKYFFSSHVHKTEGGDCSSTAIRALIKKLLVSENHKKPLSDNALAKLIGDQGINIARRTVTKYREEMGIVPSYERKAIRNSY